MAQTNFIILIGGPGLFKGCDRKHDQVWRNYLVLMQLAAKRDLYNKSPNEKVHWVVYEPPYKNRWNDDSVITKNEKKESDSYGLHSIRKSAADRIKAKSATNYLHRARQIADGMNIKYHGINKPSEFWDYLSKMPDKSISRVWYSGHASIKGLMLSLGHGAINVHGNCNAGAIKTDMIYADKIDKYQKLSSKFIIPGKQSRFYGCNTADFAREWKRIFKVNTEGALGTIDFGVIDSSSSVANVLTRIENSIPKSGHTGGHAGWTRF